MRVKPAIAGAVIRDPHTRRPLPPEGADVPDSTFWMRRLLAGDVVPVTDQAAPAAPPPAEETTP